MLNLPYHKLSKRHVKSLIIPLQLVNFSGKQGKSLSDSGHFFSVTCEDIVYSKHSWDHVAMVQDMFNVLIRITAEPTKGITVLVFPDGLDVDDSSSYVKSYEVPTSSSFSGSVSAVSV